MPIAACADRLKREISTYGNPPIFPEEEEPVPGAAKPEVLHACCTDVLFVCSLLSSLCCVVSAVC
jgi:hypothetical protein